MARTIKLLSIVLVFLLCMINFSFATDINMNLQENTVNVNNTVNETTMNNTTTRTESNETSNTERGSILSDDNTPSATVTSASSVSDDTLGLTNILNILLIVIGVVLILLGIAILIRMHS